MIAAFARIEREFGAGATLAELLFYDDKVTITARDPRQPAGFTQVLLRDDGFMRFGTPSPFSIERPLFAIGDLRTLTTARLSDLEAAALARLKLPAKSITTITIGRGGMDPSPAGNVAIEIRAEESPNGRSGRVEYELDGKVIAEYLPDEATGAAAAPAADQGDFADCSQQNDADRSMAACTRLLQGQGLSPRDRAIAYTDRGLAFAVRKELDRAIADQSEAIRIDPSYENAWNNRGLAWFDKGDLDHAIADYSAAIKLDPGSAIIRRNRARAYLDQGDFDRAIADYDEALRSEPDVDYAHYNRGLAWYRKGDFDRAIADFDDTIRINPNYAAAYGVRGRILQGRGETDRAIADYDMAIRLAPGVGLYYLDRGTALLYRGSLARAESDLKQANDLDPKNAYYALWLDIIERRNGLPSRLSEIAAAVDATAWPAPVLRFVRGELDAAGLTAAAADPDPARNRGQLCEANFYSGELALLQARKAEATPLLEAAASDCPPSFIEWDAANAELKALGAKQ
jgi:lipoprotein NlpI